jgi:hypothetical protein
MVGTRGLEPLTPTVSRKEKHRCLYYPMPTGRLRRRPERVDSCSWSANWSAFYTLASGVWCHVGIRACVNLYRSQKQCEHSQKATDKRSRCREPHRLERIDAAPVKLIESLGKLAFVMPYSRYASGTNSCPLKVERISLSPLQRPKEPATLEANDAKTARSILSILSDAFSVFLDAFELLARTCTPMWVRQMRAKH